MDENKIFSNHFGTITNKKVSVKHKNGVQDIPLKQITSVSFFRKQNKPFALANIIVGIIILIAPFTMQVFDSGVLIVAIILFIIFLLSGIANYLGNHQIIISTAGKELKPIKVEMSKTMEGKEFSDALRKQIIT